ncbi:hypothetical protein KY339_01970, partial [Candidatus Woesearchaeota archaeon]|nr:hypothetical protein [Candidatus Woesearchaeota archaeon]
TFTASAMTNSTTSVNLPFEVQPSYENLAGGDTVTISFNVTLDNEVGSYEGTVNANAVGTVLTDSVVIKAIILDNSQGLVMLTPTLLNSTEVGETVTNKVVVKNEGNKDIVANITKTGFDGFTFNIDKTSPFTFPLLSETEITYTVNVPQDKAPGTYTGKVSVTYGVNLLESNLQVNVQPTYKLGLNKNELTISADPGTDGNDGTFQIKNLGNVNITDALITYNPDDFMSNSERLNISFSQISNIDISNDPTITVNVDVPEGFASGVHSGPVVVKSSSHPEANATLTLKVDVSEIIEITNIDISSEDKDKEFKPGETMTFKVEFENLADDIDLEDIEVTLFFEDNDGDWLEDDEGDEIEEEESAEDLDAGDADDVTFEIDMPYGVKDGDEWNVVAIIRADEADSSAVHEFRYDDEEITASRETHEVIIYEVDLDREVVSCVPYTNLEVSLRNLGEKNEDVELMVESFLLGVRELKVFDMDDDPDSDEFEVEKRFRLDLTNAVPGFYSLDITAYFNDGKDTDEESVELEVQECAYDFGGSDTSGGSTDDQTGSGSSDDTGGTTTDTSDDNIVVIGAGGGEFPTTGGQFTASPPTIVTDTSRSSLRESPLYLVILVLANIAILGGLAALAVKLFQK